MGQLLDLGRLVVLQHQRLDRQHVLVTLQGVTDDRPVEMVGHGHHDHVARSHRVDPLFVDLGIHLVVRRVQRGKRRERLSGKGLGERRLLGQIAKRRRIERADFDRAQLATTLQVIDRRQQLVVRDHPAADDDNV